LRAASQAAFSVTNDQKRTDMESNSLTEESLARAFQLAYFIHGDRETALNIAAEALAKLEVAAAAQDKRLYYTPTGRAARAERFRTKVSVGELHLLQRLVYVESEPYERHAEQSPNGESPDEEDLLIYFIKHLVRITVRRNSFYVTLGLSRLLHNYSTAETMEMYNVLVQDPGRVRDDYYYRSRKGRLMKELKERFGDRLRITRGSRGEERFQTEDTPGRHAELARECLQEFTPWSTNCTVPPELDPFTEEIHDLAFDGSDPDREHAIEVNRFHAALHPDCFAHLAAGLKFASPAERLSTPYFRMAKGKNHDQDRKPPRRSRRAPQLDEAELNAIKNALAERSSRRKTVAAGLLRVIVDGSERARLDLNRASRVRFETQENDELIEVRSADGILLATYLLNQDDLSEGAPHGRSSIVLEGGQRISFSAVKNADGETAGATIDLSYRETRQSRAAALYLRRLCFTAVDLWREPRSAAWKPALTFAALMIVTLGLIFYWRGREGAPREKLAGDTTPRTIETPAPPSPTPGASPAPRNEKRRPAPAPRRRPDHSPLFAHREPQPNEQEPQPETGVVDSTIRGKRLALDGASLPAVKKVHVDPFGDDSIGKQFRDQLTSALRANRRFTLTVNRDEADAVLKGKMTTTRPEQVSVTVRLVNAKGVVLWPINGPGAGKQYQGPVATVTSRIARDLLADMDKAERK
jgi:Lipopolysaccharide-assembly